MEQLREKLEFVDDPLSPMKKSHEVLAAVLILS